MPTGLMAKPCDDACDEEAEYLVSFVVTSLEMTDEEEEELFADVLIVVTWDGKVAKLMNTKEDPKVFAESLDWLMHSTASEFSSKLKTSPIMIKLSRRCNELGTNKLAISDCFADAICCEDFNSQTVTHEFKFIKDDETNATLRAYFRVHKLLDDGTIGKLYDSLRGQRSKHAKKSKKVKKKKTGTNEISADEDKADESDDSSEDEICEDFLCPDEVSEHCKKAFGLDEEVYRIINGNLINTKEKIGPCGEKCPVAKKLIKDYCKKAPEMLPLSKRFEFNDQSPKCFEIFDCTCTKETKVGCPDCGGRVNDKPVIQKSSLPSVCKGDWIDRNIKEENLLKKLCDKYGMNINDIEAIGKPSSDVCKKRKKTKKKCRKTCKKTIKTANVPSDEKKPEKPTCEKITKVLKRCGRRKYSHDFGNSYPLHRSCSNIEEGAGDSLTVPKYIGWRWNEPILGIGYKKWYPGQINKTVKCLMKHFLDPFPYDTIPLTRRDQQGRVVKTCNDYSKLPEFDPTCAQKPALHIQKKDGEYFITINPLKDAKKLKTAFNPFLNCSPLKFSIKKHPEEIKMHQAKKILRQHGWSKRCSCIDLSCCRCKSKSEKKLLAFEMRKVSNKLMLEKELTYEDLDESSDSEMDVHFTTPSAIVDCRKCKPNVIHCGTQYQLKDFVPVKAKPTPITNDNTVHKIKRAKSDQQVKPQMKGKVKSAANPIKLKQVMVTNLERTKSKEVTSVSQSKVKRDQAPKIVKSKSSSKNFNPSAKKQVQITLKS